MPLEICHGASMWYAFQQHLLAVPFLEEREHSLALFLGSSIHVRHSWPAQTARPYWLFSPLDPRMKSFRLNSPPSPTTGYTSSV